MCDSELIHIYIHIHIHIHIHIESLRLCWKIFSLPVVPDCPRTDFLCWIVLDHPGTSKKWGFCSFCAGWSGTNKNGMFLFVIGLGLILFSLVFSFLYNSTKGIATKNFVLSLTSHKKFSASLTTTPKKLILLPPPYLIVASIAATIAVPITITMWFACTSSVQ